MKGLCNTVSASSLQTHSWMFRPAAVGSEPFTRNVTVAAARCRLDISMASEAGCRPSQTHTISMLLTKGGTVGG